MNREAHMACYFNCLFKNERLLQVLVSHVHCKCGSITETVPVVTNRKLCIAYQIEAIPMALSRLQSHSLLQVF